MDVPCIGCVCAYQVFLNIILHTWVVLVSRTTPNFLLQYLRELFYVFAKLVFRHNHLEK
jgi:hypothetical protein